MNRGPVATVATVLGISVSAHCSLGCLSSQVLERGLIDMQGTDTV